MLFLLKMLPRSRTTASGLKKSGEFNLYYMAAESTQFKNIKPAGQAPQEKRKRRGAVSEYKKSLVEKQTLKRLYGLSERQFKRYVLETLEKMGRVDDVSDELVKCLEK